MSELVSLGELKNKISIRRLVSDVDENGFQQEMWEEIKSTKAKTEFDDRLMREVFRDEGIDSTIVKIFTFRYFEGLTEKDIIMFKKEQYEIYGINNLNDENRFYKVWGKKICQ